MPTVLITGGNRGIGLELVKQYHQRGWNVIATVRDIHSMPKFEGVKTFKLESESLVDAHIVAGEILALQTKLDVIIANAGIDPSPARLADIPPAVLQRAYEVNVQGPLVLFQALRPLLRAGVRFAIIGSLAGGFSRPITPGCGAYDLSKIGVNFLQLISGPEVTSRTSGAAHPELLILALNPGGLSGMGVTGTVWRGGDLSKRMQPSETVPGMIDVLANTKEEYKGRLVNWLVVSPAVAKSRDGTVLEF